MDWKSESETGVVLAARARLRGNEGQARVCARRAAGIAARQYLERRGDRIRTSSAYDVLKLIAEDWAVSAELREIASHLILRVDEQFKLPSSIDLVAEARSFCRRLLLDEGAAP